MGDKINKYLKENIDFINYKTINDGKTSWNWRSNIKSFEILEKLLFYNLWRQLFKF